MTESLIECVPNFSEGRDRSQVDALEAAIKETSGVLLLDRTSDWDHHRSVITFAGRPEAVVEAAVRVTAEAARRIDLNRHRGIHPRVGAIDVLPFVPLLGSSLEACAELAHRAGARIQTELGLPVYFYGAAARRPERGALENVRRGGFEGLLEASLQDSTRAPDLGGPALHRTAGAVLIGARKILIALNINLRSNDLELARSMARSIRASNGGFPAVKALGLALASRKLVQVSMNLTDHEQTPLHRVYAEVAQLAAAAGVAVEETEIIGLLPRIAYKEAMDYGVPLPESSAERILEERLKPLTLGVTEVEHPFLAGEKIC